MGSCSMHVEPGASTADVIAAEVLGTGQTIVAHGTAPDPYGYAGRADDRIFYAAVRNHEHTGFMVGATWALIVLYSRQSRGEWNFTYKAMDETQCPAHEGCPAKVLDALSPTDHEHALEWRALVRADIARRAARPKVKPGDVVRFATAWTFQSGDELTELRLVKGNIFTDPVYTGSRYRLPSDWRRRDHQVAS